MADLVQATLEKLVPDIEALEEKGYFSKQELRQVITHRIRFEHLVRSKARKKEDFMRYLDYEMKLEELRELRWKGGDREDREQKNHRANTCIIRHIHGIFSRATSYYKGDIQLWMEWFQFCKAKKSNTRLSKAITEALRYNSNCPDLWIVAGQWEFNERANPRAARALMLLGIRMCAASKHLWTEYFKMELVFASRLAARRQILGIGSQEDDGLEEGDAAMEAVLKGHAAFLVLQKAFERFPSDISLRKQFLEHAAEIKFPGSQDLMDRIFASTVKDFPLDAAAWDLRARYCYSTMLATRSMQSSLESATNVYMEGLGVAPSEELNDHHYMFLHEVLEGTQQTVVTSSIKGKSSPVRTIRDKMIKCCRSAAEKGVASEKLLTNWILLTSHESGEKAALEVAEVATQKMPSSSQLWCGRINCFWLSNPSRILEGAKPSCLTALRTLIEEALTSTPMTKHSEIWLCGLKLLASAHADFSWVKSQVQNALLRPNSEEYKQSLSPVICSILDSLWYIDGREAAREFYNIISNIPRLPEQVYLAAIALELEVIHDEDSGCSRIRQLFEKAVSTHPSSGEIWMNYATFEHKFGDGINRVYLRAVQALDPHHVKVFVDYRRGLTTMNR